MSYSITVVCSPIAAADSEAWAALDALLDLPGPVPDVLRALHERLTARYPCLSSLTDDQIDDGGPGFLVLDGPGGDDAFTAEWREYSGERFQHWVAGHAGQPVEREIEIPTNGFQVTVKQNERLTADDVKLILTAFANQARRPAQFAWRNITERFV